MRTTTKLAAAGALAAALAAGPAATAWAAPPHIPFGPIGVTELSGPAGQVLRLAAPISGEAVDRATPGAYWLVARDGGVFAEGGAPFYGSLPSLGVHPAAPIVGIVPTPHDHGYWLVGADGGVFAFGSAPFYGSAVGRVDGNAPVTLTPITEVACGHTLTTGYTISWPGGIVGWAHGVMCGARSGTGPATTWTSGTTGTTITTTPAGPTGTSSTTTMTKGS